MFQLFIFFKCDGGLWKFTNGACITWPRQVMPPASCTDWLVAKRSPTRQVNMKLRIAMLVHWLRLQSRLLKHRLHLHLIFCPYYCFVSLVYLTCRDFDLFFIFHHLCTITPTTCSRQQQAILPVVYSKITTKNNLDFSKLINPKPQLIVMQINGT